MIMVDQKNPLDLLVFRKKEFLVIYMCKKYNNINKEEFHFVVVFLTEGRLAHARTDSKTKGAIFTVVCSSF